MNTYNIGVLTGMRIENLMVSSEWTNEWNENLMVSSE